MTFKALETIGLRRSLTNPKRLRKIPKKELTLTQHLWRYTSQLEMMRKLGSILKQTERPHVALTNVGMYAQRSNTGFVDAVSIQSGKMHLYAIILPMCEKDNRSQTNNSVSNRNKSPMLVHRMMSLHSKLEAKEVVCLLFPGKNRKSKKMTVVEEHQLQRMHMFLEKM